MEEARPNSKENDVASGYDDVLETNDGDNSHTRTSSRDMNGSWCASATRTIPEVASPTRHLPSVSHDLGDSIEIVLIRRKFLRPNSFADAPHFASRIALHLAKKHQNSDRKNIKLRFVDRCLLNTPLHSMMHTHFRAVVVSTMHKKKHQGHYGTYVAHGRTHDVQSQHKCVPASQKPQGSDTTELLSPRESG